MSVALVIPAAGIGTRFSQDVKKQFYQIDERPILYYTLKRLLESYPFSEIVLGLNHEDSELALSIYSELNSAVPQKTAEGGKTRAQTVLNCLRCVSSDIVLVHDAVRPFVSDEVVCSVAEKAATGGAICALDVRDTVKYAENGVIIKTIPRANVFLAHTPQGFVTEKLLHAMEFAINAGIETTDEASAMEAQGHTVLIVPSSEENIKITYYSDLGRIMYLKNKYFKD